MSDGAFEGLCGDVWRVELGTECPVCALRAALAASEAKRVEALEVVKQHQWSATGAVSGVGCCPDCGGYDPAQATNGNPYWHAGYHGNRAGHIDGCSIAALLENKGAAE